jgi:beta-galactosidase
MYSRRHFLKSTAAAASLPLLTNSVLRASISTLGSSSPHEAADTGHARRLTDGWEYFQGTLAGPWEVWHSEELATWQPVAMPHCFNAYDACDPDTPYYRGHGWYRTHVSIANPYPNGRTLLHFEGAGQETTIYVGEKLAGKHIGGYDEFAVDITDLLPTPKMDAVPITVLCDNSRNLDRMPSDFSDFSLYGGMYRHVNLVYVPVVSLETVHIQTKLPSPAGPAEITIVGTLYNPTGEANPLDITIDVTDPSGASVHHLSHTIQPWKNSTPLTTFTIPAPQLWSPAKSQLYECTITVRSKDGEYAAHERFGVRHTEWIQHGPFKLNGERLLLRGTHRHEDHAGYAAAMPDDLIYQEMQLIKDMGVNFIRLAHYQQSRRVLELCDRLGILVWEEIPWCRAGIGSEIFKEMGRRTLRNMISQHYNHPSVLLWGLGNENDWPTEYPNIDKPAIRAYLQELNDLAHQLDPSRKTTIRRLDFARDIPDVYSPSIWAGWYSGTYQEYQKSLETQRERVNHLFHAEWGADSHAGRHSEDPDKVLAQITAGKGTDERGLAYLSTGGDTRVSRDGDWSETYACNLFDWHLKTQETLPWLTGSAQWIFKDFTTPLRVENPVPRVNQKGLVERDMTKKEAYFVFQSYWSDVPMARIYGHSWHVRWGEPNEQKMVKVYSNCDTAELFVNGKSAGVKRRNSQDFPAAGLRWLTPFSPGTNNLRIIAKRGNTTVTDEISFLYQAEKWGKPASLKLTDIHRDKDKVTVEATLYDAKGILCLDARNQVRFSVAGGAKLIDNLGTSRGSRVVQLYNGRAQITLQTPPTVQSVVAVNTPGITGAFYALT